MFSKLKSKKVVGAIVGAVLLVLAGVTGQTWIKHDVVDEGVTEVICALVDCDEVATTEGE